MTTVDGGEYVSTAVRLEYCPQWGPNAYSWTLRSDYSERIIRCKDCKYCKPLSSFHKHLGCYNDFLNKHEAIPVCEQGFCAWGEPKEK